MMGKKGQSALEFMVLIAIIVAALICMQSYVKRSVQGHMRNYADQVGDEDFYSPGLTTSDFVIEITQRETTITEPKFDGEGNPIEGLSTTTTTQDLTRVKSGEEEIAPLADEPWFE